MSKKVPMIGLIITVITHDGFPGIPNCGTSCQLVLHHQGARLLHAVIIACPHPSVKHNAAHNPQPLPLNPLLQFIQLIQRLNWRHLVKVEGFQFFHDGVRFGVEEF